MSRYLGVCHTWVVRYVQIDPDGTLGDDWAFVVVAAPTGVVYRQQYGGTACRQGELEGYLVPVGPVPALRHLFERTLRRIGTWDYQWPERELRVLREGVGQVVFWVSGNETDEPLSLTLGDIEAVDEAWVPVRTPVGPGVLIWSNSD